MQVGGGAGGEAVDAGVSGRVGEDAAGVAVAGVAAGEAGVGDVPFVEAELDVDAGIGAVVTDEGGEVLPGLGAREFHVQE